MGVRMVRCIWGFVGLSLFFPSAALAMPDYSDSTFCRKLMGDREGMWIHECQSMEQDCQKALPLLAGEEQRKLDACVKQYASLESYCAVLRCASPRHPVTRDAELVIGVLPDMMSAISGGKK